MRSSTVSTLSATGAQGMKGSLLCEFQGHDAVKGRPDHLGRKVGVLDLRAQHTRLDGLLERPQQQRVGVRFRVALVHLVDVVAGQGRGHEHEFVVVREFEGEAGVAQAEGVEAVHGIGNGEGFGQILTERPEVLAADLPDQVFLVLEIQVDGARAVLRGLRDGAHGDSLVAVGGEQLAGLVQDPVPELLLFPLASFTGTHAGLLT